MYLITYFIYLYFNYFDNSANKHAEQPIRFSLALPAAHTLQL